MTGLMLCWHHLSGLPWRVNRRVLPWMGVESITLAMFVLFLAQTQAKWFPVQLCASPPFSHATLFAQQEPLGFVTRLIGFFGAGFYEEVLFRLMLFPIVALILHKVGLRPAAAWFAALVVSSLLFAAAHHLGPGGEPWNLRPFVFRFVAGALFCLLFLKRGFGVTAWSHALYDIIVGVF
ncbi:MAG: CPBP family intramembrane metalloprotease [Pirellulales bacterium]